jgi:hypothetical protein
MTSAPRAAEGQRVGWGDPSDAGRWRARWSRTCWRFPHLAQGRVACNGFRLVAGEDLLRVYRPPGGMAKVFCAVCGSSLFGGTIAALAALTYAIIEGGRVGFGAVGIVIVHAVFGFGFALVSPPIANTAVSGMPPAQAGVAAAVATTSRQVGMTLGVAVLGAVAGSGLGGGFANATRPGWWIVAALGLTVAALGYLTTTGWAQDTARRTADRYSATSKSYRDATRAMTSGVSGAACAAAARSRM